MRRARTEAARIPSTVPYFVHSHGKVGSSTVSHTLEKLIGGRAPIFHTHVLSEAARAKARQKYARGSRGGPEAHLIVSDAIAPYLDDLPFACRVISPTRNPVSRAISHTFQTIRSWAPPDARTLPPEMLARLAIDRIDELLSPSTDVADPAEWFDSEMKSVFGIDVFAQPYDFERGYLLLENGPVRALVIRMEDLNRALTPALSDLMGQPLPPVLQRANVGSAKWYGPVMQEVKRSYSTSAEQRSQVVGGRYYQHFYAPDPGLE
jgi:hypothetical protein